MPETPPALRTALLTTLALLCFAANSLLCRLALGMGTIDAASFSSLRLASGAITLWLLAEASSAGRLEARPGRWRAGLMLCLYAVAFSFAYLSLSTGTGALILFGSVQVTMIAVALASGERPRLLEWAGLAIALAGLVALVLPGLTAPPLLGTALMATAGIAWGVYSLLGRGAVDPLGETAGNFLRSVPLAVAVSLATLDQAHLSPRGIVLAVVSGALTSGLGYVVWFAALRGLTATRAATVQLAVPVLAALGGVAMLAETISLRLTLSALLILGGIGLAVLGRRPPPPREAASTT